MKNNNTNSDTFDIEIENFQSLKDVNLSLVQGINIITGRTNQGKSAIIRAIDAAIFNNGSDEQIKTGESSFKILLNNQKHNLVFQRNNNVQNEKTTYIFDNGEPQKKVGKTQLPEVIKNFNITEVNLKNNTKIKLNFWNQNDKPFLMDKSSLQLYEFFTISSCQKYFEVLKKMDADIKENNKQIQNINNDIDLLKANNLQKQQLLESNKDYHKTYDKINAWKQQNNNFIIYQQKLENFKKISIILSKKQQQLQKINNVLNALNFAKVNANLQNLINQNSILERTYFLHKNINNIHNKIQNFTNKVNSINEKLQNLVNFINKNNNSLKSCEILQQKLFLLNDKMQLLKAKNDIIDSKKSLLYNTNKSVEETQLQFKQLKQKIGFCPYCLQTFSDL